MLTLKAESRDAKTNPTAIRNAGNIPAVFYGKQAPSTPITISETDFKKIWAEGGESSVVTLQTSEGPIESLIHDVDIDPISGRPRHADFYVFEKGHKVEVDVALEFEGVSLAVKDLGGSFVKVMHELKIRSLPKDLPHVIIVDISALVTFDSQILASDIKLPAGVELMIDASEVVALVSAPREEVVEEVAAPDLSTIEVVSPKGKDEAAEGAEGAETTEK